jgi:hypothetical protein
MVRRMIETFSNHYTETIDILTETVPRIIEVLTIATIVKNPQIALPPT